MTGSDSVPMATGQTADVALAARLWATDDQASAAPTGASSAAQTGTADFVRRDEDTRPSERR